MAIWLSKSDNARLCRLSVRQYSDVIQPRLAKKAIKGRGKSLKHDATEVVTALVAYRLEQAAPAADDETDPLLAGADSPALERYRLARAKMAERDLEERSGNLVKVATLSDSLRPALAALRGTGDRLVRQFGNEAGEIYNEGVAEFESAALQAVEQLHGGGDRNPG